MKYNIDKLLIGFLIFCLLSSCIIPRNTDKEFAMNINHISSYNFTYVPDIQKYGVIDYWQPAKETVKTHSGDCEDFAIYEAALMLNRGVYEDDLKFVFFKSLLTNEYHMVLLYKDQWLMDQSGVFENAEFLGKTYFKKIATVGIYSKRSPKEYFIL